MPSLSPIRPSFFGTRLNADEWRGGSLKRFGIQLLVLWAVATLPLGAAEPVTLADAARLAVERAPAVRSSEALVDQARRGRSESSASRYPRLEAGSAFTRGDGPVYAFASLLDQRAFTAQNFDVGSLNNPGYVNNIKSYLRVGLPVFTGYEMKSNVRLAGLGLSRMEGESRGARDQIRLGVVETALRSLQARAVSAVLAERIAASEDEVAGAKKLKARGLVLGSDYFAAEAVLAGLRAWRSKIEKMAQSAEEALGIFLGQSDPVAIRGTLTGAGPGLPSTEELLTHAQGSRADLRSARLEAEMAAVERVREKASLYPQVDAMAEAQTNTEDFSSNPSQRMIMLRAQWALGDPARSARQDKVAAGERAGQERVRALDERARMEILQSVRAYEGARDALPWAIDTVDRARQSLELFRPLYREGRQSILDLLRAEEALARAESLRLETLSELHLSRARALAAAGVLDEASVAALSAALEK